MILQNEAAAGRFSEEQAVLCERFVRALLTEFWKRWPEIERALGMERG